MKKLWYNLLNCKKYNNLSFMIMYLIINLIKTRSLSLCPLERKYVKIFMYTTLKRFYDYITYMSLYSLHWSNDIVYESILLKMYNKKVCRVMKKIN